MIRSFLSPQLFNVHLEALLKETDSQKVESVHPRDHSLLAFLKANWACLFVVFLCFVWFFLNYYYFFAGD